VVVVVPVDARQGEMEVRVAVGHVAVFVFVRVQDPLEPPDSQRRSQQSQYDADTEGADRVERRVEGGPSEQEGRDGEPADDQCDVAEAETGSDQRREPRVAVLAGQRRDTRHVVGFDCVRHAESAGGRQCRHEHRHQPSAPTADVVPGGPVSGRSNRYATCIGAIYTNGNKARFRLGKYCPKCVD